jgi:hypothetical protein
LDSLSKQSVILSGGEATNFLYPEKPLEPQSKDPAAPKPGLGMAAKNMGPKGTFFACSEGGRLALQRGGIRRDGDFFWIWR